MHLLFLISLGVVLITAYVAKHSADEIAYLSTAIFLVSLLLSLVIAPWQLKCLLLIVIVLSSRRSVPPPTPPAETHTEQKSPQKLQLSYRGCSYQPTPSKVEPAEVEMAGKYRGQVWKSNCSEQMRELQPTSSLKEKNVSLTTPKSLVISKS